MGDMGASRKDFKPRIWKVSSQCHRHFDRGRFILFTDHDQCGNLNFFQFARQIQRREVVASGLKTERLVIRKAARRSFINSGFAS